MFQVKTTKRWKTDPKSPSSSPSPTCCHCFDDIIKRFTKHLVSFFKEDIKTNKLACFNEDKKSIKKKKLHLVLDLDHTLVHSVLVSKLSRKEKYLIEEVDSRVDLWRVNKGHPNEFFIKLRPFVHEFLQEANKLFFMYVYTMGSSDYAHTILKLIDPEKVYFGDRVITRKESPYKKTLNLVMADKRRVVIVDDSITVWPHHKRNLLQITKYVYFKVDDTKSRSYAEEKRDESQSNGSLANILKLLEKLYKRVEEEPDTKDLRPLIHDTCRKCCF